MRKTKRWDSDVSILNGLPHDFPIFHNWPSYKLTVLDTCGLVLESSGDSKNFQYIQDDRIKENDEHVEDCEENDESEDYVIADEEICPDSVCKLCHDRMTLEFNNDIEEWVFKDCCSIDGLPLHRLCAEYCKTNDDYRKQLDIVW